MKFYTLQLMICNLHKLKNPQWGECSKWGKQILPIFLTLFLIMGCEKTPKTPKIETVPVSIFEDLSKEDSYITVDVRTAQERLPENGGKVFENSINIDFYAVNFQEELSALDKNKKYLIYCRSGNRSGQALSMMKEMGFMEVIDLGGGVAARSVACQNNDITC